MLFILAFIRAAHACVRENVPLHSFKGVSSPCWCMFCSFLFCLLCSVSAGFRLVLGSLFPCTLQGRLFPLLVHVMFCWFPACIASLSCSFLIYTFLTFDQKKKRAKRRSMFPSTRLLCFAKVKGVCSLCRCMYSSAGFQLVSQASLALFDLYTSYI